jgi:predicted MPP superfamily phosphohydrolase
LRDGGGQNDIISCQKLRKFDSRSPPPYPSIQKRSEVRIKIFRDCNPKEEIRCMAKILHTGDWHIKIPENNELWYIKRLVKFFDVILKEQNEELIITGDIFDKIPTSLEIGLFVAFIQDVKCPIYIVAGNHDCSKRKSKRADYLGNILHFWDFPNITWTTKEPLITDEYVLVPNVWVRQKNEIPIHPDKILLSHLRHELKYAKPEYDFSKLANYKLVLLSDIHTTFRYSDSIYYSTSPYRTFKQTISSLSEIDNRIFGYNIVDTCNLSITHKEIQLPNHYVYKTSEKLGEITSEDLIDVIYEINYDQISEFEDENVVITKEDNRIDICDDIYTVIEEILYKDYKVEQPYKYITLLREIIGE